MLKSIVGFKSRIEQSRAQRSYKKILPEQLSALYGHQTKYTPTQITIAIRKAGLPVKHRKLAYQMYMTREELRAFYANSRKHRDTSALPMIELNNS